MGTDIFGLSEEEKQVVANVVYYHYKGIPSDDDDCFRVLTELQKIQVTKLVAIVRVACSLDAGSNQKIDEIRLEEKDKELIVHVRTKENNFFLLNGGRLIEILSILAKYLVWKFP